MRRLTSLIMNDGQLKVYALKTDGPITGYITGSCIFANTVTIVLHVRLAINKFICLFYFALQTILFGTLGELNLAHNDNLFNNIKNEFCCC